MPNDQTENAGSHQKDEAAESSPSGEMLGDRDPNVAGKQPGQKQNPANQNEPKWWQFSSQGVFNFLIVVIYACQAHIMNGQWSAMENQLAEMRNSSADTKIVAEAAKKTALAAQENAATSKEALNTTIEGHRFDQRAWMVYHSLSGLGATAEERRTLTVSNNRVSLMAEFVNVGSSPAFDVVVRPGYMIVGSDVPLSCKTKELPGEPASRAIVPNNNQDTPLRTEFVIDGVSPEVLREIVETKTKRLIVGGLIEYNDAFHQPRRTGFCVSYAPNDKVVSFHYCPCLNWAE